MKPYQTIISKNDREFNTSLGDWTGDAIWEPDDPPLPYGFAVFHMEPGDESKEISLEYPHLKIKPGQTHQFILQLYTNAPTFNMTIKGEITDTVYTFDGSQIITPEPYFTYLDFNADIPIDFIKAQSKLTIRVEKDVTTEEGIIYTTFYTCTYDPGKIQHLTLMGVG